MQIDAICNTEHFDLQNKYIMNHHET